MADLAARKIYAQNLRAYFTGRITNREYEECIPVGKHPAIDYIEHYFVWPEYDDFKTHRYSLCLLYTSPSPRDGLLSRMPSSA